MIGCRAAVSHQCMPACAPCEGKYPSGGWVDYFEDSWKAHLAGELKGGEQHVEAGHQVQSPHMAAPGRLRLRRRLRIRRHLEPVQHESRLDSVQTS